MPQLDHIEVGDLDAISGGQEQSVNAEGTLKTPAGEATIKAGATNKEPSRYLRCLDLVYKNAGLLESPNRIEARQKDQCYKLIDKE